MIQTNVPRDLGLVSRCNANNCTYNQGQQCTAGAIDITFMDALAQCYAYTQAPVPALRWRWERTTYPNAIDLLQKWRWGAKSRSKEEQL